MMTKFTKTLLATSVLLCFSASVSAAGQFWGDIKVDGSAYADPTEQSVTLDFSNKNVSIVGGIEDITSGTETTYTDRGISLDGSYSAVIKAKDLSVDTTSTDDTINNGHRGVQTNNGASITIQADNFSVKSADMGLFSRAQGKLNVEANNITIETTGVYGVLAQNGTDGSEVPEGAASLSLKGEQITINAKNGSGLMAFSNGQLEVEGNLVVNALNAIDTRGNATININTSGNYTTVLNGDIVFETPNSPGDAQNSGKIINSNVNVNLNGENSSWTGRAYQEYKVNGEYVQNVELESDTYYGNVTGMNIAISNGAHWEMTDDSFTNKVSITDGAYVNVSDNVTTFNAAEMVLDGGSVNLQGSADQVVTVSSLAGSGNLNVNATTEDGRTLVTPKFNVTAVSGIAPTLNVTATGVTSDQIVDAEAAMLSLSSGLDLDGINTVQTITEGNVNGAITQVIDSQGNAQEISIAQNTKLDAFGSVAALNAVSWRHELNSVSKRMGELRDAPEGVGAWARLYGSEMEYGDQNVKAKNTTIQIGSDYKIGQWTVGATVGYTDGDSDYDRGSSDNEAWNFGVYGTWFADNGQYVDLIAKYSRLSQDFKLDTMTGNYDNNAFVVSAEYGWHLPVMELGFIEPQVELTYGRIMGEDFTTGNSVRIEQDDFDSFIGRLGVRAGIKCPDNWGTIYARASVVHDFDGEFNAKARSLTTSATADIFEDLGGTWGEFGIGANINFTKNTYMYVDAEITSGGEVDENYRWNIGVRHNF